MWNVGSELKPMAQGCVLMKEKEASLTRRLGRERIWRSTPMSMCHNPVHPGKALWFPSK